MDYHSNRFEDFSLMIFKNEKLLAVLPANKVNKEIYSHQGLSYGGIIINGDLKFKEVLNIYISLFEFLSENNFEKLEIKLLPSIYCLLPNNEIEYILFLLKAELIKRDNLSVINQNFPLKISNNRIEGVKRGAKNGLAIIEEYTFDNFWNEILTPNLNRKFGIGPVHSLKEITELKNKFPNNIRQFNVYHNANVVAGATMFETETVAHCQYISGSADNNTLGSLDFLFEYLIKTVFSEKAYFDFGSSNENMGRNINRGLQYWKEGFGARTVTQDFYSILIANYRNLEEVMI